MLESAASTPNSQSSKPGTAAVVTLLGGEQDRRLLGVALALSRGGRRRITAWSLPDSARMLADRLRAATLGLRGSSEADRALRYMIEASNRGHHVPVQRLSHETQACAEQLEEIRSFGEDSLLVTGWSRGCVPSTDRCFTTVVKQYRGSVLVVMDAPAAPFAASLLVSLGPKASSHSQLEALGESLETSYPCWMRRAENLDALEPLLAELDKSDLVIVSAVHSPATEITALLDRLRAVAQGSTAALLLPAGGSREGLLSWLTGQQARGAQDQPGNVS